MRCRLLIAVLGLSLSSVVARAATITLISSSNGTFTYGLDTSGGGVAFTNGQGITLTGLFGVTGAQTDGNGGGFQISSAATSVALTYNGGGTSIYPQVIGGPSVYDIFHLTSTSLTAGSVNYALMASSSSSGQVNGPVAPAVILTPEPSTLALLGTGLMGVVGAMKRRWA